MIITAFENKIKTARGGGTVAICFDMAGRLIIE